MVYRAVDTGAGEITARSPYYFGCLTKRSEDKVTEDNPIRFYLIMLKRQ